MSAPDIGELGWLVADYEVALVAYYARSKVVSRAVAEVLAAAFGRWGGNPETRTWSAENVSIVVTFDRRRIAWVATVDVGEEWSAARADTPRSAVDQALAALRLTHPAEADALAAVVPGVPSV